MIYLFILEAFILVLGFCLKLGAFYFLVKAFNRFTSFIQFLKLLLLFELGGLLLYIAAESTLWQSRLYLPSFVLFFVALVLYPVLLGVIFVFLAKKLQVLHQKKATIVFLVMFLLITPVVSYLSVFAGSIISDIPVFEQAIEETVRGNYFFLGPFSSQQPFPLQIISRLNDSVMEQYWISNLRLFLIAR